MKNSGECFPARKIEPSNIRRTRSAAGYKIRKVSKKLAPINNRVPFSKELELSAATEPDTFWLVPIGAANVMIDPSRRRNLHRDLARMSPNDHSAILAFANEHGLLLRMEGESLSLWWREIKSLSELVRWWDKYKRGLAAELVERKLGWAQIVGDNPTGIAMGFVAKDDEQPKELLLTALIWKIQNKLDDHLVSFLDWTSGNLRTETESLLGVIYLNFAREIREYLRLESVPIVKCACRNCEISFPQTHRSQRYHDSDCRWRHNTRIQREKDC